MSEARPEPPLSAAAEDAPFIPGLKWLRPGLLFVGSCALLLMFHNFAMPLLPPTHLAVPIDTIRPETAGVVSHAYAAPLLPNAGESPNDRCLVALCEDGTPLPTLRVDAAGVRSGGHGLFTLEKGRLVFSTSDNTDPRTNGRDYDVYYPSTLYGRNTGYAATLVFLLAAAGLYFCPRRVAAHAPAIPTAGHGPGWRLTFKSHLVASAAILLLGLYCSTGTLAPYANNGHALVQPPHGYLYNPDHVHFKVLFQFVDGADRSVWDRALFLRRILFPVLAYPFMKLWGFEIGGAIGSLVLNVAGFIAFVVLVRRFVGERAAIFAAWLLALYPGAGYWGGLPYVYSTIFPFSLLLTAGLLALNKADSHVRVALIALLMGVAYLGYDLVVYFLPASVLVLVGRRKFTAAGVAVACQVAPLGLWLLFLRHGLHQSLENSNSAAFRMVAESYLHIADHVPWFELVKSSPAIALTTFFGSQFLFLPALFLLLLAVNAATTRISFHPVEKALLVVSLALFLFINLAPEHTGGPWDLRGTWVARLYQPVFPALILFAARWFQSAPPLPRSGRLARGAALLTFGAGNFLVIFGPLLGNPLGVSEAAFFAFADSRAPHTFYEGNLEAAGRRPLGF
jgi:hypothetical protein